MPYINGNTCSVSEKLEGASNTFYYNNGDFGVCSRNLNLIETEGNTRWSMARALNLEENMVNMSLNLAIQGEIIGEGVQGNHYKIKGQRFYVFNIYDIDEQEYLPTNDVHDICVVLGLDIVPIINYQLIPSTIHEGLTLADGYSLINDKVLREGLVWVCEMEKPHRNPKRVSFKTISNKYLLKHG
jgi:RNA ligase (TIGR02306 family)